MKILISGKCRSGKTLFWKEELKLKCQVMDEEDTQYTAPEEEEGDLCEVVQQERNATIKPDVHYKLEAKKAKNKEFCYRVETLVRAGNEWFKAGEREIRRKW